NLSSTRRATPPCSSSDTCTTSTARTTSIINQRRTNERRNRMEQNIVIFHLLQHTVVLRPEVQVTAILFLDSMCLWPHHHSLDRPHYHSFFPLSLSSRYRLLVSKSNPKPKNRIQSTLTLPHSLSIYPSCFAICQLSTNQTTILSLSYFHVSFPFDCPLPFFSNPSMIRRITFISLLIHPRPVSS
ncbi:hypothetical protein DFH08DRAFT_833233, partial [Mycena albidolilacea]